MPSNFFDSSALGKHYHQEVGSQKVDQLLASSGVRHFISRLTVVEMQSVFAKKVRTGVLAPTDFQLLCKRFLADVRQRKFQVVRITAGHFQAAEQLIRRLAPIRNLRTLDALQLAVALDLHGQNLTGQFICADQSLCAVATAEGLTIQNPEVP
jgi:predicted nucleic acid-binding protein